MTRSPPTAIRNRLYVWLKIAKANTPIAQRLRLLKRSPSVEGYGDRRILSASEGNGLLLEWMLRNQAFAAGKIGDTELEVLVKYERADGDADAFFHSINEKGPELDLLHLNCGVFPKEKGVLVRWAEVFIQSLSAIDLLGVWYNSGEKEIVEKYAPQASLAKIRAVEPYYHDDPWTRALAGKRVVVVTPFEGSILHQWQRRSGTDLFPENPSILPDFDLRLVRAPFSAALRAPVHSDWHAGLTDLKGRIATREFDIALIGAGAFSLPLCAFVRTDLGRSAVHLGGAMQLLFGVKGRRWARHPVISKLFNDNWIKPLPQERPRGRWKNDGGAYW